jgi:hypothetical protein
MEKGYGYLFDEQVISHTTQGREHSDALIVEATIRAIQLAHDKPAPAPAPAPVADKAPAAPEQVSVVHTDKTLTLLDRFKAAVISKHGSAKKAFKSISKNGLVSKKEFKKALMHLMPELTIMEGKVLRKQLPKKLKLEAFIAFVDPAAEGAKSEPASVNDQTRAGLAELPNEVPEIPSSFMQRPHAQQQLLLALVDNNASRSTAVTAPKSKIASQGSM